MLLLSLSTPKRLCECELGFAYSHIYCVYDCAVEDVLIIMYGKSTDVDEGNLSVYIDRMLYTDYTVCGYRQYKRVYHPYHLCIYWPQLPCLPALL